MIKGFNARSFGESVHGLIVTPASQCSRHKEHKIQSLCYIWNLLFPYIYEFSGHARCENNGWPCPCGAKTGPLLWFMALEPESHDLCCSEQVGLNRSDRCCQQNCAEEKYETYNNSAVQQRSFTFFGIRERQHNFTVALLEDFIIQHVFKNKEILKKNETLNCHFASNKSFVVLIRN